MFIGVGFTVGKPIAWPSEGGNGNGGGSGGGGGGNQDVGSISAEGWLFIADGDLSGEFDPHGNPETLTVTRAGFDAVANPVTVTEAVVKMKRRRLGVDNNYVLTNRDVALSWPIYQGETIAGITNGSTRAVPTPCAAWMVPDREYIADTLSTTCRLFVAHAEGRDGTPVAAVRFILEDAQGNTAEALVSTLTPAVMPVSGHTVPCYEAEIDVSGLAEGALIRDAIIYPHVGAAFRLSVDGDGYPCEAGISDIRAVLDKGGLGRVFTYVDAAGGDDGAGQTYPSEAAAIAGSAFRTVGAAADACEAANGGEASRIVLVLKEGQTHVLPTSLYGLAVDGAAADTVPPRIKGEGTGAVVEDDGVGNASYMPRQVTFENLTIRKTPTGSRIFANRANKQSVRAESLATLIGCTLDPGGDPGANNFMSHCGRFQMFDCAVGWPNPATIFKNSYANYVQAVGCTGVGGQGVVHCLGSHVTAKLHFSSPTNNFNGHVAPCWCYNHIDNSNGDKNNVFADGSGPGERGMAVTGSIGEIKGATNDDNVEYVTVNEVEGLNAVFAHNSWPGGNSGMGYNQFGSVRYRKEAYMVGNLFHRFTVQGDGSNTPDETRTGADFIRYKVGAYGNVFQQSYGGNVGYTPSSSNGEVAGLAEWMGDGSGAEAPGWASDATATGSNDLVGGDYRVTVNRPALPRLPARHVHYSHDIQGTPIALDGSAVCGALQAG